MLMEYISSESKSIPDEQANVLKGDTPFDTIIECIVSQFDEFLQTGYVKKDKMNYIDKMKDAIQLSKQINAIDIDEYEIDHGESIIQMEEMFHDTIMELMAAIDVDLYQIDDPIKIAYFLYTNFMLVGQRESFFNFVIERTVISSGLETDLAIAHGKMMQDDPEEMFHQVEMLFDGKNEQSYIMEFLNDCGYSDILQWVADGFMPIDTLYNVFLSMKKDIAYMFIGYYQNEKEKYERMNASHGNE